MSYRDGSEIIPYVKTKNGFRFVPLNSKALDTLKRIKELNQIKGVSTEYILENVKPSMLDKALRRVQRALNFDEIRSMHDVRRTFATELYYSGVSIKEIKTWMGHSTEAQTYAYICFREDPESRKKLENIG